MFQRLCLIYIQIKINNIFNDYFLSLLEYFVVFVAIATHDKNFEKIYREFNFQSLQQMKI